VVPDRDSVYVLKPYDLQWAGGRTGAALLRGIRLLSRSWWRWSRKKAATGGESAQRSALPAQAAFGANVAPATFAGRYDGARFGRVHGWAVDFTRPTARLIVEAVGLSGARVLAIADRYRADVHKSGWGDGYSGFAIPLDRLGGSAGLKVFCSHPRFELPLSATLPTGGRPVVVQRQSYTFYLDDRLPGTPLTGWAVDWDCPDRRRLLQLQCAGGSVVRRRATLYREDIRHLRTDGYLGFSLPPPAGQGATITDLENGVCVRVMP
jgi:hypothetical protein